MLNTYNLKMVGIKKASSETVDWTTRSGGHTEVFYNMETGEVWTVDQIGNSWTQYRNSAIIKVADTTKHMTMQEIATHIAKAVRCR